MEQVDCIVKEDRGRKFLGKSTWIIEIDVEGTAEETQRGGDGKVVAEIRYDEDRRKVNWVETVADKCGGVYVGQQEHRK